MDANRDTLTILSQTVQLSLTFRDRTLKLHSSKSYSIIEFNP